ncbi:MAG: hypothetical protein OXG04_29280 [Acidobacteria bacterium]|nr:hypothetical protein [Acidobacteriota bacterium]
MQDAAVAGLGGAAIDYRHIVGSLVRKPAALARYRFREELFPSLMVRAPYNALCRTHGARSDVDHVGLWHFAATTSERRVEATLAFVSTLANPATTSPFRPRFVHRYRPSPWSTSPARISRGTTGLLVGDRADVTAVSTHVTLLLTRFGPTATPEEDVPRLMQAGPAAKSPRATPRIATIRQNSRRVLSGFPDGVRSSGLNTHEPLQRCEKGAKWLDR